MSQFYNYIKSFGDKTVNIYIDMDGVVADYDFEGYINDGTKDDVYLNKRPVISSINPLKEVSQLSNVNLHILSVSRYERQINGKLTWLDKNMDFIKKENIFILPRDTNDFKKSKDLKRDFLEEKTNNNDINIHIDDSHEVLETLRDLGANLIILHVTSLID